MFIFEKVNSSSREQMHFVNYLKRNYLLWVQIYTGNSSLSVSQLVNFIRLLPPPAPVSLTEYRCHYLQSC